jgi:uncharacterized protein with PIN domain
MNVLTVRFYGGLNYFLPQQRKQIPFCQSFNGQPTVKELVESLGVPHTEVDLILIDGVSAGFDQQLRGGERISVYPAFRSIDVSAVTRVRPEPLPQIRFLLDVHLGKLASYLRMAGFDTRYSSSAPDSELAERSASERRILLTFDRGLLKRKNVMHGYCVRSRDPATQLKEVLDHFGLSDKLHPFSRCMRCNGVLEHVVKTEVYDRLPEKVREYAEDFTICRGCGRIYWKGTHYERMIETIEKAISSD